MTRTTPIPEIVTIHVPFRLVKRGGRKEMQMPTDIRAHRHPDDALIKALARAFRWKRMLESGEFMTLADLADREGIAPSYITRVLRLTQLEPGIIEAVLDGRQGDAVTLARLMDPLPISWNEQKNTFSGT